MNTLRELQEKQKRLDDYIIKKQGLQGQDLLQNKIIALDVELSELANELEFFKHWKINKGKGGELEEACDCLHFILSIANDLNVELIENYWKTPYGLKDLSCAYKNLKWEVNRKFKFNINSVFNFFMNMAELAGLTYEDLIKEYDRKYEINIQRQVEGY